MLLDILNSSSAPLLEVSHLKQVFNEGTDKEFKLFEDFNLNISGDKTKSNFISIMGPSGCGKSCLLRAIAHLSNFQSGDIKVNGVSERKSVPMVFQQYSNYNWMTVLDNVALPLFTRGVEKKEARIAAMQLLKLVGLQDHAHKYAGTNLSGGQKQRIAIARGLACESDVLLLDEATASLDYKMSREVQNILKAICASRKTTVINVTHKVEEACLLSDYIVILQKNPCKVHSIINVNYSDRNVASPSFQSYAAKVMQLMDEVC